MASRDALVLSLALLVVPLAGCTDGPPAARVELSEEPYYAAANGHYHFRFTAEGKGPFHLDFAPGSVSFIENTGETPVTLALGETTLLIVDGEGGKRFQLPADTELGPGARVDFLAPPSAETLRLLFDGAEAAFHSTDARDYEPSWNQILSGENWYDLMLVQQEQFPHRTPGQPNYPLAIDYFTQFFTDLGYEVEADPYGLREVPSTGLACPTGPTRGTICPETLANVIAWKPGTTNPDEVVLVAGGHFDMVVSTTHAAFDDTSGTVATMELARAMAPYAFDRTVMFALWGGEESGLMGSNFFLAHHPELVPRIVSYWNLDVVSASWPAPLPAPDPLEISAGPDAPPPDRGGAPVDPMAQDMLAWARTLQQQWFGFPDEVDGTPLWQYEGVAAGQTSEAGGSNAQSDHTAFLARGIPAFASAHGDWRGKLSIHSDSDTLANLTKYAVFGIEFDPQNPMWPSAALEAQGRDALERSIETVMLFPFYHAVLVDLGVYTPPQRVAPSAS